MARNAAGHDGAGPPVATSRWLVENGFHKPAARGYGIAAGRIG